MRLIDADAFIQMMEEKCDPESTLDPWVLSVCRGGVKMMPTVDAAPVVRCRDCESYQINFHWCGLHYMEMHPKDFCSYGERKDGDHHD